MTSIINQIEDYREILSNNLAYELENEEFKGHSKNGLKGVFTRDRKLTFKNLIVIIIIFKSSIQRELDRFLRWSKMMISILGKSLKVLFPKHELS